MHLDEGRLQRLRDGELTPAEETAAREHLERCESCRARFLEIEREQELLLARLGELDEPAPPIPAAAIVARGEQRARMERGAPARSRGRERDAVSARASVPRWAWAAGLLVALGLAGLGYAVPGSPLRAWVRALAHRDAGGTPAPAAPAPGAADSELAGVSVAPGERLLISFLGPQARARVDVQWGEGSEVEVRAPRGAATFTTGAETLQIDNPDSLARFEIRVPRAAPRVEIQVQGARIYLEERGRVTQSTASVLLGT